MEHPNFLVCDKYERSYIHLKSVENPNFRGSEAEIVCQIQDFDENLSEGDFSTKIAISRFCGSRCVNFPTKTVERKVLNFCVHP